MIPLGHRLDQSQLPEMPFLLGIAFLFFHFRDVDQRGQLDERGVLVHGAVLGTVGGTPYCETDRVTYTDKEGHVRFAKICVPKGRFPNGEAIDLKYLPEAPEIVGMAQDAPQERSALIIGGSLFLAGCCGLYIKWRERRR